ncbi:MAG: chemotaxis protein CheA [Gammaproteobacteria bacterium]
MALDIDLSEFHDVFFEECSEGLAVAESGLLRLNEGTADAETINAIFRAIHSIKGGGATFGFAELSAFAHVMETLLDEMRAGSRAVTREAVDLLLASADCLNDMVSATKLKAPLDMTRVSDLKQQLNTLLGQASQPASVVSAPSPAGKAEGWLIHFRPFKDLLRSGNDPYRLFRELSTLGKLAVRADVAKLPELDELDPESCHLSWELTLEGDATRAQVADIFAWVEGDCELEISPIGSQKIDAESAAVTPAQEAPVMLAPAVTEPDRSHPEPRAQTESAGRKAQTSGQESSSIRVSIDKVDALVNLVGELVITQSMLSRFAEGFDMSQIDELRDGISQLMRNTRELQETAMRIRMLPISTCFNRFPRMVHDLSQKLGKKVELKLSGEQTELDKTVLEKINDPLVHLVRNALDHGLETPAIRRAAGKPDTGMIHLNAYHEGGNIVIEVRDDGAGLNKQKILAKARAKGLVGPEEQPSDDEINNLICQPGFSTADQVSDISGRGVGMDVVKRNISDLGGQVHIYSEEGKGSTLTIRLPLTLAILDGQLVRVGRETYIIPLVSIVESLQVKSGQVNAIAGRAELYLLRDDYIPIVRLYEVFNCEPESTNLEQGLLVVVEAERRRVGLFVDDLMGQQQVVIKSLETNFRQVPGLSGATILGDGRVALILDVPGLIQTHCRAAGPRPALATAA